MFDLFPSFFPYKWCIHCLVIILHQSSNFVFEVDLVTIVKNIQFSNKFSEIKKFRGQISINIQKTDKQRTVALHDQVLSSLTLTQHNC